MINVNLKGNMIVLDDHTCLSDVLTNNNFENTVFAIAVNQQFVPRSCYAETILKEGDVIDIITPMQGG